MNLKLPTTFEELDQFKCGLLLNCFLNLNRGENNYETQALHVGAHMFFSIHQKKKNQSERKKTGRLHTVFKKENDMLIIKDEISEAGLCFVDKFISNFSLRKKLAKVRSKISAKK